LDSMILEVFSNLNDSVILHPPCSDGADALERAKGQARLDALGKKGLSRC